MLSEIEKELALRSKIQLDFSQFLKNKELDLYQTCLGIIKLLSERPDPDPCLEDWLGKISLICGGHGLRWVPAPDIGSGYFEIIDFKEGRLLVLNRTRLKKPISIKQTAYECLRVGTQFKGLIETEGYPFLNTDDPNLIFLGHQSFHSRFNTQFRVSEETRIATLILPPTTQDGTIFDVKAPYLSAELNSMLQEEQAEFHSYFSHYKSSNTTSTCANELLISNYEGSRRYEFMKIKTRELVCHIDGLLEEFQRSSKQTYRFRVSDRHKLELARRLILDNLSTKYSIDMLANEVGISRNRFAYLFKNYFGHTVHSFIVNARMESAQYLLRNSDMTISDISRKTGYKDASAFTKAVNKYFGVLPSKLREG